jgi:uncharacterized protein (DUF697 family)
MSWLKSLKGAIAHLNPAEVAAEAARPVRIGVHAATELSYFHIESFFVPESYSEGRRARAERVLERIEPDQHGQSPHRVFDIEIHTEGAGAPPGSIPFSFSEPERTVHQILAEKPELALSLSRALAPFREPVTSRIIHTVARENAVFSLATALPDVVPFLSLPWVAGEFASDTGVLTANQVRMALLLAAASDRDVGYREQRAEIASLIAGAFGWRSLARELAGHIPFGGGLIPKAAIAYAGTWVVGRSIERYYRLGYGLTRAERRAAYDSAIEKGRRIAKAILQARNRSRVLSRQPG